MSTRTKKPPGRIGFRWSTTALIAGLLAMAGASGSSTPSSPIGSFGIDAESAQRADYEWVAVTYGAGVEVEVAIFKPDNYSDSGNHPLILALPWGGGTPSLTLGMVATYWNREASRRGYVVVAPSIRGPSLATEADGFLPALFSWLDENVSYDPARVVAAGASAGGMGVFHAVVSDPARFAAVIAMPGRYSGPTEALQPFAGKPFWLMVGELDSSWLPPTEATRTTLEAAGITPRVDLIEGQGHVLQIDDRILMDWPDEVLEGS